jgi:hypothetical protein
VVNQSGAYAGVANSSVDNATGNITLGSRFISSLNGAASAPPATLTGTWFTGGTATTTKPQLLLEPAGTTSTAWSTAGTGLGINATSGFTGRLLDLQVNGTSRVVADGDGKLLVGTVNALSFASPASTVNIQSFSANPNGFAIVSSTSNVIANAGSSLVLARRAGGGTVAAALLVGSVQYQGFDGTNYLNCASIEAFVDGLPGTNDMPGRLVFSTTLDGAASPTERLRITSAGNVGIGTTGPTTLLDVNSNAVRLRTARTPASATATGAQGEISWDADYIYVCTATNTWKRAALTTW